MSLRLKKKPQADIPPLETGSYPAVCVGVTDIGTQVSDKYGEQTKVIITWEIAGKSITIEGEEKPRYMSEYYTVSFGRNSRLRPLLETWRGVDLEDEVLEREGIDLTEFLGLACLLQVKKEKREDGTFRNKVTGAVCWPEALPQPEAVTPGWAFDLDEFSEDALAAIPLDWIQGAVRKSVEYQRDHTPTDAVSIDGGQAVTQNAGDPGQKPAPEVPAVQAPAAGAQTAENTVDSSLLRNYFDRTKKVEVPF